MFWYIIWLLVSASIFSKSMEKDKWEWLAAPSLLSSALSLFALLFGFIGII